MTTHSIIRLLGGATFALLLSCATCRAAAGTVRDGGAFFSEQAKSEAARNITEIGRRFRKDLVIETFREIPAALSQQLNLQIRRPSTGCSTNGPCGRHEN
jgi:hypothetical protein